jgi:hypothetical protein
VRGSLSFLSLYQHLLPRGLAWRTTVETTLRKFFVGLSGLPTDIRTFVDLVYLDLLPPTTRELTSWEKQFALNPGGSEAARREKIATAWSTQGRQSPDYIQRTLHAAGFTTVFIHEWWQSGPPYVAHDPRDYTTQPLIGIYQCEGSTPWECFAAGASQPLAPHCDDSLINDPGYLVNLDLTRRAPPPVSDDPSRWPYFLYFAGETFPDLAPVPASRIAELKELLLRISPAQQWLVLLIEAVDETEGFGSGDFGAAPLGA